MEMLAEKLVQPRKKGTNDDAACICIKSVAAEVSSETGRLLVGRTIPVLRKGLPPDVRPPTAVLCVVLVSNCETFFYQHRNPAYDQCGIITFSAKTCKALILSD
jgi:hypothetical protein